MLGHIFPVFYGFHGGKGVLIAATTLIAIDPLTCAFSVAVFAIVLAATKYVSVGSICAAIAYPVFTPIVQLFIIKGDGVLANTLMATAIGLLIIICTDLISTPYERHRKQIRKQEKGVREVLLWQILLYSVQADLVLHWQ